MTWQILRLVVPLGLRQAGGCGMPGAARGRARPEGHWVKERLPGDLEESALVGAVGDRGEHVPGEDAEDVARAVAPRLAAGVPDDERLAARACPQHLLPDRKSTRLNSSHVEISYA